MSQLMGTLVLPWHSLVRIFLPCDSLDCCDAWLGWAGLSFPLLIRLRFFSLINDGIIRAAQLNH